jgi:hypothetical protein
MPTDWHTHLAATGPTLQDSELDVLSDRFRLSSDQIADAVATTVNQAVWQASYVEQSPESFTPKLKDLCAAARTQSGHVLATLAQKNEPRSSWADMALTAAFLAASDRGRITNHHLMGAVQREYQKMGKILMTADFIEHKSNPEWS